MFERKGEFNFVLIGAKSTGKTWYIKHLAKREGVTALDDNTIEYIDIISEQDKGTSISYTELFFTYKDDTYYIDFQIDDYDGNFVETWHKSEENSEYKEKLTEYVKESEGIFIFLPYEDENNTVRFDSMQKETDVFINKIKEEYGEEHSELPIPVIIVVSKWDESPDFGKNNENEKAKEYIESNPVLKLIKNKIYTHFKHIDIIPLSSEKDYNVELPIRMCSDYTFKNWEEKIENLKERKEELLIFLHGILYDIRFYKDGKYKKLYDEIEEELAGKYLREMRQLKNVTEFGSYYANAYKVAKHTSDGLNEDNVLDCLSDKYTEEIEQIRQKLSKQKKLKRIFVGLIATSILGFGLFIYNNYAHHQAEKKLYSDIQIEYKNKNITTAMDHIEMYSTEYNGIDKEHYDALKLLGEKIKSQYRMMIDEELKLLVNNKSIIKSYEIINEINGKAKKYGVPSVQLEMIENEFYKFENLKDIYESVSSMIDQLSLETIEKKKIDKILQDKNMLTGSDEVQIVKDNLNKKLQFIIASSLESDDGEKVNLMIELASTIGVSNEIITQLHITRKNIKVIQQFNEFSESLKNLDEVTDVISQVTSNWKNQYGESEKEKIRQIILEKYNTWLAKALKDTPKSVDIVDDYNRVIDFLSKNKTLTDSMKILPIDMITFASGDNLKMMNKAFDLYNKYYIIFKNGIATTTFIFYATEGNNFGLTSTDDKVTVYIDGYEVYNYNSSRGFHNGKMQFSNKKIYKVQKYTLKLKEEDIIDDDYLPGSFSINSNQLIKLENKGFLDIGLGDVYSIKIRK